MTARSRQVALAAVALCVVVAVAMIGTGTPLHWSKGVVVAGSCARAADGHVCQVELVPDGALVTVRSDAALVGGDWVELRVWHDMLSGNDTYTVVR
jgi:hypothetical protein